MTASADEPWPWSPALDGPTAIYVVSGMSFIRRDDHGAILLDTAALDPPSVMPPVLWSERSPAHTLENTGPDPLVLIGVELKD